MARYRLKYCFKGLLSQNNQPTNHLKLDLPYFDYDKSCVPAAPDGDLSLGSSNLPLFSVLGCFVIKSKGCQVAMNKL